MSGTHRTPGLVTAIGLSIYPHRTIYLPPVLEGSRWSKGSWTIYLPPSDHLFTPCTGGSNFPQVLEWVPDYLSTPIGLSTYPLYWGVPGGRKGPGSVPWQGLQRRCACHTCAHVTLAPVTLAHMHASARACGHVHTQTCLALEPFLSALPAGFS
jgi:hypothetical protein